MAMKRAVLYGGISAKMYYIVAIDIDDVKHLYSYCPVRDGNCQLQGVYKSVSKPFEFK